MNEESDMQNDMNDEEHMEQNLIGSQKADRNELLVTRKPRNIDR